MAKIGSGNDNRQTQKVHTFVVMRAGSMEGGGGS